LAADDRYFIASSHGTILYADPDAPCVRHAPLTSAPLNLVLQLNGSRGRLIMTGESSSEQNQIRFAHQGSDILMGAESREFDCVITGVADDGISIRIGKQYLSADRDGVVRHDRASYRDGEPFRLVTHDMLMELALLSQHSWLSHGDRRLVSLDDDRIDLRRELRFGPARLELAEMRKSLFFEGADGNGGKLPARLHTVGTSGAAHSFSRFKPLVYYCVYGHDSYYECLRLSLTSLALHGRYRGTIGLACDRPASEIMGFIPAPFKDRVIVTATSKDRGWFNQYYLDHGLYEEFQPVLYTDVDVVFDCDITNLLIDILRQEKVCCATEAGAYPDLAARPPRDWADWRGDYFGHYLYAQEPELPDPSVPVGNAGIVGFDKVARIRAVNDLVKAVASRQTPQHLKTFGDQPILNYVLHKTSLGDFDLMSRYCRLARNLEDAPPTERRGMVHFHLTTNALNASDKSSVMAAYLDALERHREEAKAPTHEVQLNLDIPGQVREAALDRLARLARLVPPNGCIVEIGSLFGLSSWTLAKNAHPSVTVYCIDPWVRESWMASIEASAGQTLSLEAFRKNVAGAHNIVPLPGYSPRDFMGWQRTVDLVFEDSVHSNPGLHATLAFWSQFVPRGGVVCGHDYRNEFPDVMTEADRLAMSLGTKIELVETLWSVTVPREGVR
jgi:hypothetical protein